jgi:hypothetical protein
VHEGHQLPVKWGRFLDDLPREAAIVAFAGTRHDVITSAELAAFGLDSSAVAKWARRGRLFRRHRGVFAVGRPRLGFEGRVYAAVRAAGARALASHRSAAGLRALLADHRRIVDVTVPGTSAGRRGAIVRHASLTLVADDVSVVEGIPCTSVARTLVDLADSEPRRVVERALGQAEVLRVFDLSATQAAVERAGCRRGAAVLRALLGLYATPTLTRSELEERFLGLCRNGGLPQPEVNTPVATHDGALEVDFLWRAERLVVETDGRAFHATASGVERDRRRDRRLRLAGYEPIRFGWREVVEEPDEVLREVRGMLARLARP